jgi:tetratricopeptide (TPR) repeat protein
MPLPARDSSAGISPLQPARDAAARGDWGEVRALLNGVPADAGDRDSVILLAEAHLRTGALTEARALLTPLAARTAPEGNTPFRRRVVNMLGAAAFELGDLAEAETRFQEALLYGSSGDDPMAIGRATNNLGMIAHIRGQYEQAIAGYQLAVPAYQRTGSVVGLAETCHNMALALRELDQLDAADRQERRAIGYAREAGNVRLLAMAQVGRAELSLLRGEAAVAEAGGQRGAAQYATIPDYLGEADALRITGAARTALGNIDSARAALDRAVILAHQHGSALIEAESREARARLWAVLGDWNALRVDAEAALVLLGQLGAARDREELEAWYREVVPA